MCKLNNLLRYSSLISWNSYLSTLQWSREDEEQEDMWDEKKVTKKKKNCYDSDRERERGRERTANSVSIWIVSTY